MKEQVIDDMEVLSSTFKEIRSLVIQSRNKVYSVVNTEMLNLYWNIGRIIMNIQNGDVRASYGDCVIDKLADELTKEFWKGFSTQNLRRMRQFYCMFEKRSTVSSKPVLVSLFGIN